MWLTSSRCLTSSVSIETHTTTFPLPAAPSRSQSWKTSTAPSNLSRRSQKKPKQRSWSPKYSTRRTRASSKMSTKHMSRNTWESRSRKTSQITKRGSGDKYLEMACTMIWLKIRLSRTIKRYQKYYKIERRHPKIIISWKQVSCPRWIQIKKWQSLRLAVNWNR